MKIAQFTNFTNDEFIGYWDGKGKKFAPGQSIAMPDYLASHFALHLVNRELLKRNKDGSLLIPNGDKYVSPKKPEDVPVFMDLFNKAFVLDELDELGEKRDDIDVLIDVANKNRGNDQHPTNVESNDKGKTGSNPVPAEKQDPTKPQVIVPPDFEEDDDEESFGGKPVETAPVTQAPAPQTPVATTPPTESTPPAPPTNTAGTQN
jgi:hypothetical protein